MATDPTQRPAPPAALAEPPSDEPPADESAGDEPAGDEPPSEPPEAPPPHPLDKVPGLKRLVRTHSIWLDVQGKRVIVEGRVVFRQGALEMFACPAGTKEHESVVAVDCKAFHVHAALVALGAKPIHPVRFDPEYVPARGTEVAIEVLWRDREGANRRAPAQSWVKEHRTGKTLQHNWVFGGSQFWKEPDSPREVYLAEDGDLICVSNFTTATLDVPIKSSAEAEQVLFMANTEKIPAIGTRVRLVLTPLLNK